MLMKYGVLTGWESNMREVENLICVKIYTREKREIPKSAFEPNKL